LLFGAPFNQLIAQPQKKVANTRSSRKKDARKAEIFPHYQYRFAVPETQADTLWKYLQQNFAPLKDPQNPKNTGIEEEQLTDLYFDTPDKKLLNRNLALRQRLFISAEGRKQHLQLLIPARPGAVLEYQAIFKHNKRPDKGKAFTSHPLLKLLRKKDRPLLDSLLRLHQIEVNSLQTALEISQDRRRFPVMKNRNAWLIITLTHLEVQAPEQQHIQLQIEADPEALKHADPAVLQQLMKATDALAKQFTDRFPALKQERKQEYAVMTAIQKKPPVQKFSTKAVFGISFLVLILAALLYSKFRKKPVQGFD
jgi:hypothetical protein